MIGMQEVILIFAILLLVFGPKKLPKIARELGKVWNEFNKASSGVMEAVSSTQATKDEDEEELLLEVARKLKVNSEGKSDEQLTTEILTKIINKEKTSN